MARTALAILLASPRGVTLHCWGQEDIVPRSEAELPLRLLAYQGHRGATQEATHLRDLLIGDFLYRHPPLVTQEGVEADEVLVADERFGRERDDIRAHMVGFFGGDTEEVVSAEDLFH